MFGSLTDCEGSALWLYVVHAGIVHRLQHLQACGLSISLWLGNPSKKAAPSLPPWQPHHPSTALLKRQVMTRLADCSEAGITATTVVSRQRAGEVVRLARGLYKLSDEPLRRSVARTKIAGTPTRGSVAWRHGTLTGDPHRFASEPGVLILRQRPGRVMDLQRVVHG